MNGKHETIFKSIPLRTTVSLREKELKTLSSLPTRLDSKEADKKT